MALIAAADVQPWLESTKLRIDNNDALPEAEIQAAIVLARLGTFVDTSLWVDSETTPYLIRVIIGMRVASQRYNAAYSETSEDEGNPYADKLMAMSEELLLGIIGGSVIVPGIDTPFATGEGSISFYPRDSTGLLMEGEEKKFTMGRTF